MRRIIEQKTPKCEIGSHAETASEAKAPMPTAIEWKEAKPASKRTYDSREGSERTTCAGCCAEACHESMSIAIASKEKAAVSGEARRVSSST